MAGSQQAVVRVGNVDDPDAKTVRIVHVSDTHLHHATHYLPKLPAGDILVHSGDFCTIGWSRLFKTPDYASHIDQINQFFSQVPHAHKILVGGNHDMAIASRRQDEIQKLLPSVTYLQDSDVTLAGIKFYGSPWTAYKWTSYNTAFVQKWGAFEHHWDAIPTDTDVVVTHMPPHGIRDMARREKFRRVTGHEGRCDVCSETHPGLCHRGCPRLRDTILNRVR